MGGERKMWTHQILEVRPSSVTQNTHTHTPEIRFGSFQGDNVHCVDILVKTESFLKKNTCGFRATCTSTCTRDSAVAFCSRHTISQYCRQCRLPNRRGGRDRSTGGRSRCSPGISLPCLLRPPRLSRVPLPPSPFPPSLLPLTPSHPPTPDG